MCWIWGWSEGHKKKSDIRIAIPAWMGVPSSLSLHPCQSSWTNPSFRRWTISNNPNDSQSEQFWLSNLPQRTWKLLDTANFPWPVYLVAPTITEWTMMDKGSLSLRTYVCTCGAYHMRSMLLGTFHAFVTLDLAHVFFDSFSAFFDAHEETFILSFQAKPIIHREKWERGWTSPRASTVGSSCNLISSRGGRLLEPGGHLTPLACP